MDCENVWKIRMMKVHLLMMEINCMKCQDLLQLWPLRQNNISDKLRPNKKIEIKSQNKNINNNLLVAIFSKSRHIYIDFFTIYPFIRWFLSQKIRGMLLTRIYLVNISYIFIHVWSWNTFKTLVMNKVTIITSVTTWSWVKILTWNCLLF